MEGTVPCVMVCRVYGTSSHSTLGPTPIVLQPHQSAATDDGTTHRSVAVLIKHNIIASMFLHYHTALAPQIVAPYCTLFMHALVQDVALRLTTASQELSHQQQCHSLKLQFQRCQQEMPCKLEQTKYRMET